jgi:hypothetical protein
LVNNGDIAEQSYSKSSDRSPLEMRPACDIMMDAIGVFQWLIQL